MNAIMTAPKPSTLKELQESGWQSKSVKDELKDNFMRMLANGEELFPGIVGYDDTVIPEINLALLAGHDMLFLGEKGQAKSRIMRMLTRFLDEWVPYIDHPDMTIHEDPQHPISNLGRRVVAEHDPEDIKIGWWHRDGRYAERLSPQM
jgi:magnesium chelatase subunit I